MCAILNCEWICLQKYVRCDIEVRVDMLVAAVFGAKLNSE